MALTYYSLIVSPWFLSSVDIIPPVFLRLFHMVPYLISGQSSQNRELTVVPHSWFLRPGRNVTGLHGELVGPTVPTSLAEMGSQPRSAGGSRMVASSASVVGRNMVVNGVASRESMASSCIGSHLIPNKRGVWLRISDQRGPLVVDRCRCSCVRKLWIGSCVGHCGRASPCYRHPIGLLVHHIGMLVGCCRVPPELNRTPWPC
jgi:hypothetical protein